MFVCYECYVLSGRGSLRRTDHSSRGVLPNVMRRCVWSRNLKNEEAMARVGPQRHRGGGYTVWSQTSRSWCSPWYTFENLGDVVLCFLSLWNERRLPRMTSICRPVVEESVICLETFAETKLVKVVSRRQPHRRVHVFRSSRDWLYPILMV